MLLYALLNGFLPFDDDNIAYLYKKIQVRHILVLIIHLLATVLCILVVIPPTKYL